MKSALVKSALLKNGLVILMFCLAALLAGCEGGSDEVPTAAAKLDRDIELILQPAELDWVGQKIFQNECAGQFECLVHWNVGEAFPSLGIGHFIWYPEGVNGKFTESFPDLVQYMIQRKASVPGWLQSLDPLDAPWPDRSSFLELENSDRVAEFREFLAETQGVQARFMFQRAGGSLANIIAAVPEGEVRDAVIGHLRALASTPGGVYALVDYVNFKGEGLSESERYKGQGWGLRQVLVEMDSVDDHPALDRFREAAGRVLTRRAQNADNEIERTRWLAGWMKRLETYREPDNLLVHPVGG
ncbi:hypothetical protein FWJ25_05800 [Marinobacter salinexigens]|uniref:Uncharacterized protein n=2 Tax=Marinobacter salinexigens TaxID=2919747 RepID=A0A5B0VLH8_9GAMM|nr:hypothetical protein FWJ25_05800 [Marinobacter salinexigens]